MPSFWGFNANRLKPNLKMSTHRLQLVASKKTNSIKTAKKQIATLLKEGKEEKARIRTEALIRDDFTIEAYEILELQCDLLFERMKLLESSKECPVDLVSCVSTLIWASDRVDCPELIEVKKQLILKFGKKFEEAALNNWRNVLNDRVVHKLSVQPPSGFLVLSYLREIATQYDIDFEPSDDLLEASSETASRAPTGYSVPTAPGSQYTNAYEQQIRELEEEEIDVPAGVAPSLPDRWGDEEDGEGTPAEIKPGSMQPPAAIVQQQQQQPPPVHKVSTDYQNGYDAGKRDTAATLTTKKGSYGGAHYSYDHTEVADVEVVKVDATAVEGDVVEEKEEEKSNSNGKSDKGGKEQDYDDLAARFNALKK